MREEELIKKLESVELPEIELQSHRRRLRMALLAAGYLQRQPGVTILDLAKSRVKGGIDTIIQGLVSRQPVWKTAVTGVLAVALIAGLAIGLPSLTGQLPEALAESIVRNSPEVRAALGGGEVEAIRVLIIDGDEGIVILYREEIGQYVLARVDLETAEVTEIAVVSMPTELTEAEKEKAIAIAKADPSIKELLDQGASIDRVTLLRFLTLGIHPDEILLDEVVLDEETDFAIGKVALIDLRLGDKEWHAMIDLDEGKVLSLSAPPTGFRAFMNNLVYRSAAHGMIIAIGILILIGLSIKNRLAVAVAGIASIVFGITGLSFVLYSVPSAAWPLVLVLGIPIVGLVGIVEIRRRATRKWIAITGVVICSLVLDLYLVSIVNAILASHRAASIFQAIEQAIDSW